MSHSRRPANEQAREIYERVLKYHNSAIEQTRALAQRLDSDSASRATGRYESEASHDDGFVGNLVYVTIAAIMITVMFLLGQQWSDSCENRGGHVVQKSHDSWCIGPRGEVLE